MSVFLQAANAQEPPIAAKQSESEKTRARPSAWE